MAQSRSFDKVLLQAVDVCRIFLKNCENTRGQRDLYIERRSSACALADLKCNAQACCIGFI